MKTKILATIDVVAAFAITLLLVGAAGASSLADWVRHVSHRAFLEYVVMIAVPLSILLASRRDLANHGISFRNLRCHLGVAMTAFVPVAVASVSLAFIDHTAWDGALILVPTELALLFAVGFLLRSKPTLGDSNVLVAVPLIGLAGGLAAKPTIGNAFSPLLFYVFFLGLGEELLFRGYIQSRLNMAFGRPVTLFGVPWGCGAVIAAALYGLMHVINLGSLIAGQWHLAPWWGLWTFAAGLVGAFVREMSGSIVAPTILHGLPQGIAYAFLGL